MALKMSSKFKSEDIMKLLRDSKQVAELVYNTISQHIKKCDDIKEKISEIARNLKKGTSLALQKITGAMFMDMIEVTALAPHYMKEKLHDLRSKLENELIGSTRISTQVSRLVREFLDAFYKAYGKHYEIVFGEQMKSLIALQGLISKSSEELAKAGTFDAQDQDYEKVKSNLDSAEKEKREDDSSSPLESWLTDPVKQKEEDNE
jgi:hypothetical protein